MIIIMKTTSSPGMISWVRPHAFFDGSLKEAKKLCDELNKKATTNVYDCEKIKVIKNDKR